MASASSSPVRPQPDRFIIGLPVFRVWAQVGLQLEIHDLRQRNGAFDSYEADILERLLNSHGSLGYRATRHEMQDKHGWPFKTASERKAFNDDFTIAWNRARKAVLRMKEAGCRGG